MAGLAVLPLTAATGFAQELELGAARFVAPAGWSQERQARIQVFSRALGRERCMIVVSADEPAPPGSEGFAQAWRTIASGPLRSAKQPSSREATTPAGSRYMTGEGELEDGSGNRLVARLHVFPLGSRSQWFVLLGNGAAALASCEGDWNAFFSSLRLQTVAAESVAPVAPVSTTSPESRDATGGDAPATGPQEFGNLRFIPPRGWTIRRQNDLVLLSATGTRGQEKLEVLFLAGRASSGSLETELDATWGEIQSLLNAQLLRNVSGRTYDLDKPARSLTGVEYLRGNGGMRTGGGEWDVSVYAFRAGERVERVAVLARAFTDNLTRYTTANNPSFSKDIRRLLFRMKFANLPERPLAPAGLKSGGIVGVWAGLGMSYGSIKTELAVFFDNGLAYFGPSFPLEGLHEIDPLVEQPTHQRYWGTYTWTGSSGALTMPYGTIPLSSNGTGLTLTTNQTPHRYIRLALPLNARLDGTWCYSGGSCLRFTPEGRFEDNGAVRVAEHSLYAWPESPASGAGTYSLRDHTLYLKYDGGPELRVAFPGVQDGRTSSPNELWFGWNFDLLTRR